MALIFYIFFLNQLILLFFRTVLVLFQFFYLSFLMRQQFTNMESHISHLIASFFAARPKGFSTKRINQYLKLNDYKNNSINIFKLYMQSYNNTEVIKIDENVANTYVYDNFNITMQY